MDIKEYKLDLVVGLFNDFFPNGYIAPTKIII
jgi:hypothetical protein